MCLSEAVHKFIEKENLFSHSDHLLVAVSGGVDSMVLLQILHSQGFNVSVAHVNYKLRDIDSDKDYELVKEYCNTHQLNFHFYPLTEVEKHHLKRGNLQEKARNLRHTWFQTLMEQHKYQYLCTAHHKNDQIETFLLNSMRGSGLTGLTSMTANKDKIKRPLLPWFKSEIVDYADLNNVSYRTDHTNIESTYDRNYLRNEILEKVYSRFQQAKSGLAKTTDILTDEKSLLNFFIEQNRAKYLVKENSQVKLGPITELSIIPGARSLIYGFIAEYGYNAHDVDDILESFSRNGASFLSNTFESVIQDDFLYLRAKTIRKIVDKRIQSLGRWGLQDGSLNIREVNNKNWSQENNKELVDLEKISFPLTIRNSQEGDRFYPIGMGGRSKKLSDYLSDKKLKPFEKEKVRLLCSKDQIIWVVGYRLDDRFKVTEQSQKIGEVQWIENS